ncbi:tol-pal system-associated acyl-CoA thioesterase [Brackiella oedipodis]|uniref:tol-pal system-associated acyl-CoA thioesterase n=1 Tax=Brackiella oedipodis TaxID=124225 RepID=UPI00048C5B63|nr:tol-pal system-associated acyl-CoA thioesterase [Brackiella oedipodis]
MTQSKEFSHRVRIYYEDTDAGGIVFYANYLKFFERARTEWLRQLGVNQSQLAQSQQRIFIVVSTELKYISPARLDDVLTIHSRITKVDKASVIFEQTAYCDERLLNQSAIRVCCVNSQTFKPAAIPQDIRSLLLSVQDN